MYFTLTPISGTMLRLLATQVNSLHIVYSTYVTVYITDSFDTYK